MSPTETLACLRHPHGALPQENCPPLSALPESQPSSTPSLYAALDVFPSRKGAAIHIDRFAHALFRRSGGGLLYVLGHEGLPAYQREGAIEIVRHSEPAANYLTRAMTFSARLSQLLETRADSLELCHFRDIWSGIALLARPRRYRAIFEVNALPSIELPATYPLIAPSTLAKIRHHEQLCLHHADHLVVPSHTLRATLLSRGVTSDKITVVPNGADLPAPTPRPAAFPGPYLLYFGALQPWQGVDTLLRAFARLADFTDLRLVICASHDSRRVRSLQRLAQALGVDSRIDWHFGLDEAQLAPWREHAALSVAPLTDCARNLEQGCAPLKILESMASGVPVVASDIPSVRELIDDRIHGRLVHPERPGELARVIRVLLQDPAQRLAMGQRARERIRHEFLWERSLAKLNAVYARVLHDHTAV